MCYFIKIILRYHFNELNNFKWKDIGLIYSVIQFL